MRFAKEDKSPLWRRGLDSVVLLNPQDLEVKAEYPNFWSPGYTPMFLNINETNDTIYGYSMSNSDSMFTVLSISGSETTAKSVNIPPEHKWAGMELSTDGKMMIIANACKRPKVDRARADGKKNEFVKMMAIDLENLDKIRTVCYKDFTKENFSAVQFMRKIKGHDLFIVACKGSLAVIQLKDKDSITRVTQGSRIGGSQVSQKSNLEKEFIVVNFFENLYNSYIFEVAIFGDWMVPVTIGANHEMMKMIKFNSTGSSGIQSSQFSQSFGKIPLENSPHSQSGLRRIDISMSEISAEYSQAQSLVQSEPIIRQLEAPKIKGHKKISVSPDGRNLFYGGDSGLYVLKRQNNESNFKIARHDENLSYFALRPTPSGHLVLQMNHSNDLMVLDRKLRKQIDFKGKRKDSTISYRQPHFSFEGQKMIWFGDKYSFSIIDLRDLSQTIVSNLLPEMQGSNHPEPRFSIADFYRSKVLVFYEMEGEGVLVYHEKDREPDMHLASDKFNQFEKVNTLDLTKNKLFGVMGGTSKSTGNPSACISIFAFNQNLSIVFFKEFPDVPTATTITKTCMSHIQEDVMIAATDGPLLILGFDTDKKRVDVLKVIDMNINGKQPCSYTHLGLYTDMCIFGDSLFMVTEDENRGLMQVKFSGDI